MKKNYHLVRMINQPTQLDYAFADSPFGRILLAATPMGLCAITMVNDEAEALTNLAERFPGSSLQEDAINLPKLAAQLFDRTSGALAVSVVTVGTPVTSTPIEEPLVLHLKGTPFQLKVWEALLSIPLGETRSYNWVAREIGQPGANRAVGTAVGANPVFYVVPCHRVIRSDGSLGQYYWGPTVKASILDWEQRAI